MIFVSSWDDGHPLDTRVADYYAARDLRTTFYVPLRNSEARPVMLPEELRAIDGIGFEIGSHTADHLYLDRVSVVEMHEQIVSGKDGLEQILGHAVRGFCYPGGRSPRSARHILKASGITYARTTENLRTDRQFDGYSVPTTLQFYPHGWKVLMRNSLRFPTRLVQKLDFISQYTRSGQSLVAVGKLIESMIEQDVVFHLWGHSWEVEQLGAWRDLAYLLDGIRAAKIQTLTVEQCVLQMDVV